MHISVIVPTYKPKEYLWECLGSLANQTLAKDDFEVILVLNGCKEPYESKIKNYLKDKNLLNVLLIQTDQLGVSNARNIGLDLAKGEYITFIDDDDYVSSSYLEELYSRANPEIVPLCRPLAFEDGKSDFHPYRITEDFDKNALSVKIPFYKVKKFFSGPVYKLIHRSIIGDRRFDISFKNGEDSLFMFLISDKLNWVSFTSQNAIYYRRRRMGSATSSERYISFLFNRMKLIWKYSMIYFNNISNYNFYFYVTRIAASLNSIFFRH